MGPFLTLNSHLYDRLALVAEPDGDGGRARLRLAPGVRCAAALGLALERSTEPYLFTTHASVPIRLDMHVRRDLRMIEAVIAHSRLTHDGRRLKVTECVIVADGTDDVVGWGQATWSVVGPAEPQTGDLERHLPAAPAHVIDLADVMGLEPLVDGSGYRVAAVSDAMAGPGGILHAGVLQLLAERAAIDVDGFGGAASDCAHSFLAPARHGPFVARAAPLSDERDARDYRVEVRDLSADRLASVSYVTVAGGAGQTGDRPSGR